MFKWGETKLHFCSVLLLLCKFSHKLHGWARWEHLHFSCFLFSSAEQFLNYSVDCEIVCTDTLCHARAWNSLNSPLSSPLWPASSQYGQFSTFSPHTLYLFLTQPLFSTFLVVGLTITRSFLNPTALFNNLRRLSWLVVAHSRLFFPWCSFCAATDHFLSHRLSTVCFFFNLTQQVQD